MSVPDVQGKSESSATSALESLGFEVSVSYDYSSSVDSGYVISQSPSGGEKLAKGVTVYIVVSQGEHTATVPDVVGSSLDNAKSSLGNNGFDYYVQYAYSDSVTAGCVISQSPSGGSTATYGSTVTLTVSEGPEAEPEPVYVNVPNCVGNDLASAEADLVALNLAYDVQYVTDVAPLDYVISTSPGAGTQVEEQTVVTLVVSDGTG
jgi:serine/threonine-protein kinase